MTKKKKKTEPKQLLKLETKFPGLDEKRSATLPVDELAKREDVSAPALAGMRTAYGWSSNSRLTIEDFKAKARSWLNSTGR